MSENILHGNGVVKGKAEGVALVGKDPISFWGTVELETGIIQEKGHDLFGESVVGKVLVYTTGKGSSGSSARLYSLIKAGLGPVAILNVEAEVVTIIGAIMGEIPMMDKFDQNPIETINTGDYVLVDSEKGVVKVIKERNRVDI